jgi:hypothetical protein
MFQQQDLCRYHLIPIVGLKSKWQETKKIIIPKDLKPKCHKQNTLIEKRVG